MNINKRTEAFSKLGEFLFNIGNSSEEYPQDHHLFHYQRKFEDIIKQASINNPWFIEKNIRYSFVALGSMLNATDLNKWTQAYMPEITKSGSQYNVGLIMAGNVPVVGFHDFLCVLMAGHRLKIKCASSDKDLLPAIADVLLSIEPAFSEEIHFSNDMLKDFNAVIATGSNNSRRYFEYYFRKHPHIIRNNRNGIAVLDGNEEPEELLALAEDIFLYFGLGCRNVSKIYVPYQYDFTKLFPSFEKFSWVADHNKYRNNYDYNKSLYLINNIDHLDNGFLIITANDSISSPVSVLHYEFYDEIEVLRNKLHKHADEIQCIIGSNNLIPETICFGGSQKPKLWDYADGVDTMRFLIDLQ